MPDEILSADEVLRRKVAGSRRRWALVRFREAAARAEDIHLDEAISLVKRGDLEAALALLKGTPRKIKLTAKEWRERVRDNGMWRASSRP